MGLYNQPIPLIYISDHENADGTSLDVSLLWSPSQFQIQRDLDNKLRAHTLFALNLDGATVVLHDSVGDRQPQAGTLTDGFGGKERVEDFAPDSLVDTCSVIAN